MKSDNKGLVDGETDVGIEILPAQYIAKRLGE
jgi:hypothetical protein